MTARKYTNQKGVENTYYDAFLMDAESNTMDRFRGQLQIKPTVGTHSLCEGRKVTAHIMQVLELRNGIPVCQVKLKSEPSPLPSKPAKAAEGLHSCQAQNPCSAQWRTVTGSISKPFGQVSTPSAMSMSAKKAGE